MITRLPRSVANEYSSALMQIWDSVANFKNVSPGALQFDQQSLAAFEKHDLVAREISFTGLDIAQIYSQDRIPIPPTELRENYFGDDHHSYWLSGLADTLKIDKHAPEWRSARNILELGCSTGRVLRHLVRENQHANFWAADVKRSSIDWLRNFAAAPTRKFFHSTSVPYLPFETGSFDFICAFSVFTHINQAEEGWLLELHRLLRPGAKLYLTMMTERVWPTINEEHALYQNYKASLNFGELDFAKPFPGEKVIWKFSSSDGVYAETVIHSQSYIERNWLPFFKTSQLIPFGHQFQDVLVLEK